MRNDKLRMRNDKLRMRKLSRAAQPILILSLSKDDEQNLD